MSENPGVLTEEERKAIDYELDSPLRDSLGFDIREKEEPSNIEARKTGIRDTVGSATDLAETLDDIRADLLRIRDLHVELEKPEGQYDEWVNWMLPEAYEQIRELKSVLEQWQRSAESTQYEEYRQEIRQIILYELFEFDIPEDTRLMFNALDEFVVNRKDALYGILEPDHGNPRKLYELLDEIVEGPHPVTVSGKQMIGGNNRRWHANKRLKTDFGLVENYGEWDNQFIPTERGEAVHATVSALLDSAAVQQTTVIKDIPEFEAAKRVVDRFADPLGNLVVPGSDDVSEETDESGEYFELLIEEEYADQLGSLAEEYDCGMNRAAEIAIKRANENQQ